MKNQKKSEYKKAWYQANKTTLSEKQKLYRAANKEKIKAYHASIPAEKKASYKNRRRDKNALYMAEYRRINKVKLKLYQKEYLSKNLNLRLAGVLRKRLGKALKNNQKVGSAVQDLGCSIEELKLHLESKFSPGMVWNNYGHKGWHIDHILPLSKFDLTDREQLKLVCHYTNLQPLWAVDNIRKNDKIAA